MPIIRSYYDNKLKHALKDSSKKDNSDQSNNFMIERLQTQIIVKAIRNFIALCAFTFFLGSFWSLLLNVYLNDKDTYPSFNNNEEFDVNIGPKTAFEK